MEKFKQEKKLQVSEGPMEVRSFQPRSLTGTVVNDYESTKSKFGTLAATDSEADTRFNMHPASRKYLGIENEEHRHLEGRINEEVEKRLQELREQARVEGFAKGREEGIAAAKEEFSQQSQPVFDHFQKVLVEFEGAKDEIFHANEEFLIQLVFQIAQQVTLKELKTDREYVKNLCSQLVEKIGAKDHVKIKIGKDDFEQIDAIREHLKQQFIDLKNIQIDVSEEFNSGGCKVETDLARINASVETQLQLISQALGAQ
jgi:flagellar assembly protein FliH